MYQLCINPNYRGFEYKNTFRNERKYYRILSLPDFFCSQKFFFCLLWSLNFIGAIAGNQDDPAGGRSSGLSHASVTLRDGWSCYNNQAGLGYLENPVCGFYFENRYNVKEFSTKAVFIAYPFHPGTVAFNYRHFGYSKNSRSPAINFRKKLFRI